MCIIEGKITEVRAANAGVNPPVTKQVTVEIVKPLQSVGTKVVFPPVGGQIELTKLEFKAAEINPYKAMHANQVLTVDFRNPFSLRTYIECRDELSQVDQLQRFDNDIRAHYKMQGYDQRCAEHLGWDTMRMNGLLRAYRAWVRASQVNPNWTHDASLQLALEIVQEIEQQVFLFEEQMNPGTGRRTGPEVVYNRALKKWKQTVLTFDTMKPDEQEWSRAVMLARQRSMK